MHTPSILTRVFFESGNSLRETSLTYKIAGECQQADIFTKGLPRVAFHSSANQVERHQLEQ